MISRNPKYVPEPKPERAFPMSFWLVPLELIALTAIVQIWAKPPLRLELDARSEQIVYILSGCALLTTALFGNRLAKGAAKAYRGALLGATVPPLVVAVLGAFAGSAARFAPVSASALVLWIGVVGPSWMAYRKLGSVESEGSSNPTNQA